MLGYPVEEWRQIDICDLQGGLIINGTPGPEGNASDILGHPLAALVWLAKQKATLGQKLKANDFVMLGSLVKTHWFDSPGSAIARIPQLGEVSVVFK